VTTPHHLITRNKQFYYCIRIPADLKHHFSCKFIKRSLKTPDKVHAKEDARHLDQMVTKTFRLLRSGLLSEEQAESLVSKLLPKKKTVTTTLEQKVMLTDMIEAYIKEHERKWGHKTKLENQGSYKLILDVIGDMVVAAISKQTIVDLRSKLERLPANMYKIYPDKTAKEVLKMAEITPMSTTSVNKHIFRLSSILKFAIKEGHILVNFAESMKIPQRRRADEERKAYSREDIRCV